jgi:hypothetical protein
LACIQVERPPGSDGRRVLGASSSHSIQVRVPGPRVGPAASPRGDRSNSRQVMMKRTNQALWRLVGALAVVVLGGCWVLLTHGVSLPGIRLQLTVNDHWCNDRPRFCSHEPERGGWEVTRTTNLGFFGIAISRLEPYGTSEDSPRPAGGPASRPNGTGR